MKRRWSPRSSGVPSPAPAWTLPPPSHCRRSSPLWSLENVFITPHTSGISVQLWEREGELLLDNLERWFSGQPLRNLVDKARGY